MRLPIAFAIICPIAIRYSPFAAVFGSVKPRPPNLLPFSSVCPRECSKTNHATGFSQWLMTNFLSAEFIRRLESRWLEGRVPARPNFKRQRRNAALRSNGFCESVQEHCPPEELFANRLFAIRRRFWLGKTSPSQFPCPVSPVPCPALSRWLRKQAC